MVEVEKCELCGLISNNHKCRVCGIEGMTHKEFIDHTFTKEHDRKERIRFLKTIYCEKCDLQCETRKQYDKHILGLKHNKNSNDLFCEKCNMKYRFKKEYDAHLLTKKHLNGLQNKDEFFCEKCNVKSNCKSAFELHLKTKRHLK